MKLFVDNDVTMYKITSTFFLPNMITSGLSFCLLCTLPLFFFPVFFELHPLSLLPFITFKQINKHMVKKMMT